MKILVTAASKHHSTAQIAGAIAAGLTEAGIPTSPTELERVHSLDGVDAVVLGSGVYMGRWLEEARDFVKAHREELRRLPVWLFSSGPLGTDADQPQSAEPHDGARFADELQAVDHRVFAGRMTKAETSLPERAVARLAKAPYGDYRDWDEIADWTGTIAATLRQTTA
jgi:menaquinone-dependent protoporphyrinogen oxidase